MICADYQSPEVLQVVVVSFSVSDDGCLGRDVDCGEVSSQRGESVLFQYVEKGKCLCFSSLFAKAILDLPCAYLMISV